MTSLLLAAALNKVAEPLIKTCNLKRQKQIMAHLKSFLKFRNLHFALQLFLHFTVGAAPSAGMEMDIIVEKTSTVKEVRK